MKSYIFVNKSFPRCGACIYCSGEKVIYGDIIQYESYSIGRCNNFQSPAYGKNLSADYYCFCRKDY